MKIKTITEELPFSNRFDDKVNKAMDDGWRLARRDVIPAGSNPDSHRLLYAELVQLDPAPEVPEGDAPGAPEPQPADPFDAVRAIKAACLATSNDDCCTDRCPLYGWCVKLRNGGDPTDWEIPEKGDAPA